MEILKQHLTDAHNLEFEHIERTFPAARLFEEWKSTVENERFFNLVADHSEQVNKKGEGVRTLVCNRSGTYKGKGASQRCYPQKGPTSKIGRPCTCAIKVRKCPSGEVQVDGCLTHYGHCTEIAHSRVPALERDKLAGT